MNKLLDKVEKNYLKGSLKTKTTEIVEHLELSVVLHYNCDGMLPDSLQWIQNSAARLVTSLVYMNPFLEQRLVQA